MKMKWPQSGRTTVFRFGIVSKSDAQTGPVMKSASPVITSDGAVIRGSSGRRSKVETISLLKSSRASATGISPFSVSSYASPASS